VASGIDAPMFEDARSERGQKLRDRQKIYGLVLSDGPRAYPADLLKKIEVVNDGDSRSSFAVVYDRSSDEAQFYDRRINGQEVTFGTTGYACGSSSDPTNGKPLLYDRKTHSLWLPKGPSLVCVNGALTGTKLPVSQTPAKTSWADWRARHPLTSILIGSDRSKPIPTE
jgi:hypothetical protein